LRNERTKKNVKRIMMAAISLGALEGNLLLPLKIIFYFLRLALEQSDPLRCLGFLFFPFFPLFPKTYDDTEDGRVRIFFTGTAIDRERLHEHGVI
jgi:hypothetical protein